MAAYVPHRAGIAVAPVMTITGVGASTATLHHEHGPVAVVLDLVNPRLAAACQPRWQARRGIKAKTTNGGHTCYLAGLHRELRLLAVRKRMGKPPKE
jgi:hypothetical protein